MICFCKLLAGLDLVFIYGSSRVQNMSTHRRFTWALRADKNEVARTSVVSFLAFLILIHFHILVIKKIVRQVNQWGSSFVVTFGFQGSQLLLYFLILCFWAVSVWSLRLYSVESKVLEILSLTEFIELSVFIFFVLVFSFFFFEMDPRLFLFFDLTDCLRILCR